LGGVLLVDKPPDLTSFGVVERVRGWFRLKKVGHTGTLDPFATGLLVLCVGNATRLAQYVTPWDKEYEGVIRLGIETDTDDPTGAVVGEGDPGNVTLTVLEQAIGAFRGEIEQVPPRFSAKKRDGVPAYKRARRGENVELPPVRVRIYRLEVRSVDLPMVHFRALCSKGTYMRSVARDLGRVLGCGAHLHELRRTAVGDLRVEDALNIEAIEAHKGRPIGDLLWSSDRILSHWEAVFLNAEEIRMVRHGKDLHLKGIEGRLDGERGPGSYVRLKGQTGDLLAIGRLSASPAGIIIHPDMVFASGQGINFSQDLKVSGTKGHYA
jgi:tRNA pseudouridine55 synthase